MPDQSNTHQLVQSESNKPAAGLLLIVENVIKLLFVVLVWLVGTYLATTGYFKPSYVLGIRDTLTVLVLLNLLVTGLEVIRKYKKYM